MAWHAIGYLIFAAVLVAGIFLATATYSRVETAPGSVVVDKGTAAIVATRAGVVSGLGVHEAQTVKAGQVLAEIRSEEDLAGGSTAPDRVLNSLAEQDRELAGQAAMVLSAGAAERSRLAASINGAGDEIATLDRQIADQRELVALAERQFQQAQGVAAKGFLSRRDLDGYEATLLSRKQQLSQLQQQRTAKLTSVADSRHMLEQSDATSKAQSVAVQAQRSALAQQIAQYAAAKGYALTSPVDGTVTALTARSGQPVTQGQQLMVVVPSGGRVRVELYVPTSAAGFLRRGQAVRLAIDAFPYQQFGTVPAHISDIATAPVLKQLGGSASVPVYIVTAELDRDSVRAFGRDQPLIPGMTLSARIITRRQSLFEWLFEPLFAVGRR